MTHDSFLTQKMATLQTFTAYSFEGLAFSFALRPVSFNRASEILVWSIGKYLYKLEQVQKK